MGRRLARGARLRLGVVGLALTVSAPAWAQSSQPAQEIPYSPPATAPIAFGSPADAGLLETLRRDYLTGNWTTFSAAASTVVAAVRTAAPSTFDPARDYVLLVWPQQLPTADAPALVAALVHPGGLDPFAFVLPGLSRTSDAKLMEIVVTEHPAPIVASEYTSKPTPDPLLSQVPQAAGDLVKPLFTFFGALAPRAMSPMHLTDVIPAPFTAVVRRVDLPEPRASVTVKLTATLPLTPNDLATQLATAEATLEAQGKLQSADAEAVTKVVMAAAAGAPCNTAALAAAPKTQADCRNALDRVVTDRADRLGKAAEPLHAFVEGLKDVEVVGTFTLDDTPLTKLSLGLVTSYAPRIAGASQPVKVDKNTIAADPVARTLQMVVVNLAPWGYQTETARRWTGRAFFKPFVGAVFDPTVGVSAGASFALLDNIGVNVGYAWLFVTTPRSGLALGDDLSSKNVDGTFTFSDDLRATPLTRGVLRAVFVGVSYSFK